MEDRRQPTQRQPNLSTHRHSFVPLLSTGLSTATLDNTQERNSDTCFACVCCVLTYARSVLLLAIKLFRRLANYFLSSSG
ncbi:hypothetical protein P879_09594 [Paragonimus westermani]|uniref:Uncharacterized protein n=1 Tax=Paragonimus westermani TaxID=34504 RepID=A0A8T0DD13_9TREM|nr:hypothetical protein P879_09594 [Paragonimus westermani]